MAESRIYMVVQLLRSRDGDMVSCDASKVTLQRDDDTFVRGNDDSDANTFGN